MPYLPCHDAQIYYEEFGRGEPILFLHSAFSRGLLAFSAQIQPLQGKYRCLIPDFRGHGRSLCEDLTWDSARHAEDMLAFLDGLGIEKAHLLGYSMGSGVGLYLAANHPERVRSLIAIGASHDPMPEGADDCLPEALLRAGDQTFIDDMIARHQDAHRGDWQTYLRQTVADWKNHPHLTPSQWQAITCPVFFISGEHDEFSDLRALQANCPHARCYQVPDGSHRPHFILEQGAKITRMILDYLAELK